VSGGGNGGAGRESQGPGGRNGWMDLGGKGLQRGRCSRCCDGSGSGGWQKREGVWRKNNICGENVKNAGEKKLGTSRGPHMSISDSNLNDSENGI
jgi:hypothetical protein